MVLYSIVDRMAQAWLDVSDDCLVRIRRRLCFYNGAGIQTGSGKRVLVGQLPTLLSRQDFSHVIMTAPVSFWLSRARSEVINAILYSAIINESRGIKNLSLIHI